VIGFKFKYPLENLLMDSCNPGAISLVDGIASNGKHTPNGPN